MPIASPHVECYHMLNQKLFLTVPPSHPLAIKSYVRLEDVRDENFICVSRPSPLHDITKNYFDMAGFLPKVVCEVSTPSLMPPLVNSGLGVALMPDTFSEHSTVRRVSVSDPHCLHPVYFIWIKNRVFSEPTQNFLNFTLNYYKDFPKSPENV